MIGFCLGLGLGQLAVPLDGDLPAPPPPPPPPPPPDPDPGPTPDVLQIDTLADGTFEITIDDGVVTLTLTSPAIYAGTYTVDSTALASGPVNIVPPVLSGTPAVGETLTLTPGLWVYDAAAGTPVVTYPAPAGLTLDTDGASYVVQPEDAGTALSVTERATDSNGTRTVQSNGLAVPSSASLSVDLIGAPVMIQQGTGTATITVDLTGYAAGDTIALVYGQQGTPTGATLGGASMQKETTEEAATGWGGSGGRSTLFTHVLTADGAPGTEITVNTNVTTVHAFVLVGIKDGSIDVFARQYANDGLGFDLLVTPNGTRNTIVVAALGRREPFSGDGMSFSANLTSVFNAPADGTIAAGAAFARADDVPAGAFAITADGAATNRASLIALAISETS